jgi:hypothetical protein
LFTLTRSRAIDRLRARRARPEPAADERQTANLVDPGVSPDLQLLSAEQIDRVRAALESLPALQRAAIELAYYEGLTHVEVAARLEQPLGTIKTRTGWRSENSVTHWQGRSDDRRRARGLARAGGALRAGRTAARRTPAVRGARRRLRRVRREVCSLTAVLTMLAQAVPQIDPPLGASAARVMESVGVLRRVTAPLPAAGLTGAAPWLAMACVSPR